MYGCRTPGASEFGTSLFDLCGPVAPCESHALISWHKLVTIRVAMFREEAVRESQACAACPRAAPTASGAVAGASSAGCGTGGTCSAWAEL